MVELKIVGKYVAGIKFAKTLRLKFSAFVTQTESNRETKDASRYREVIRCWSKEEVLQGLHSVPRNIVISSNSCLEKTEDRSF